MSAEEFNFLEDSSGVSIGPLGFPNEENDTTQSFLGSEETAREASQLEPTIIFTIDEDDNVIELFSSDGFNIPDPPFDGTDKADLFNVTPETTIEQADKIAKFELGKDALSMPQEGIDLNDLKLSDSYIEMGGKRYRPVEAKSSETGQPYKIVALIELAEESQIVGSQVPTPTSPTGASLTLFSPVQTPVAATEFDPGPPIGSIQPTGVVLTTVEIPVFTGGAGTP
ncbi:MAG: hypothetical protein F6K35_26935, partial [Okeania sp. SIO2H7]|nr:hypothetical protein [Okeania sp. SIO2H7]